MNTIHPKTDQLDLNLLKVFEAAYREQHLGRAAQAAFFIGGEIRAVVELHAKHESGVTFVQLGERLRLDKSAAMRRAKVSPSGGASCRNR